MRVVLYGAPGSGKGVLAGGLSEVIGAQALSSGAMLRQVAERKNELGRQVDKFLRSGSLVPDQMVAQVVAEVLLRQGLDRSFLLDGFPRTLTQAEHLEQLAAPDRVLFLSVSEETLTERILGRLVCEPCSLSYHRTFAPPRRAGLCNVCGHPLTHRNDDTLEVVGRRLSEYRSQTEPVEEFYRQKGRLVVVDAEDEPEQILQAAVRAVQNLLPK